MNIYFMPVRYGDITKYWPTARVFLAFAVARGCEKTLDEIELLIRGGKYLLICFMDSEKTMIGALTLEQGPNCVHMCQLSGYRYKEYEKETMEFVISLARLYGKDEVTCQGRKGWQRRLKKYGFVKRGKLLCHSDSPTQPTRPTRPYPAPPEKIFRAV